MVRPNFALQSIGVSAGLLIAAAHFTAIYVFHALACSRGFFTIEVFGLGIVALAIALLTVLALVAVAYIGWSAAHRRATSAGQVPVDRFLRWLTGAMAGLGAIAILWSALPVLIVPVCV